MTSYITCSHEGCDEKVANHHWGKVKAVGWFFGRMDDKSYCPKHLPDWVATWRLKQQERNK